MNKILRKSADYKDPEWFEINISKGAYVHDH